MSGLLAFVIDFLSFIGGLVFLALLAFFPFILGIKAGYKLKEDEVKKEVSHAR